MRRLVAKGLVGAGVACVLAVASALAFEPLVRTMVERRAALLGISVSFRRVVPRWSGVALSGVVARFVGVEAVEMRLDRVEVDIGTSLGVSGVRALGGHVGVTGDVDEVRAQLGRWSDARLGGGDGKAGGAGGAPVDLREIGFSWEGGGRKVQARRVRVVRRDSDAVSVELGSILVGGEGFRVSGAEIAFELKGSRANRRVVKVGAQGLEADLHLDESKELGAALVARAAPGKELGAALVPNAAPDKESLSSSVRARLKKFAEIAERYLGDGARFEVGGLRLRVRSGEQVLNLGPSGLQVAREGELVRVRLLPQSTLTSSEALTLEAELPFEGAPFSFKVDGGPVRLGALGVHEGDFGLRGVDKTRVEARGRIVLARDEDATEVSAGGRFENLSLHSPALSEEVVSGVDFGWDLGARVSLGGRRVEVSALTLRLGEVTASLTGSAVRDTGGLVLSGKGEVPLSACSSLLAAVPAGIAPFAATMSMRGTFALRGEVEFDSRRPLGARIGLEMENGCKIVQFGDEIAPARFLAPFRRSVKNRAGQEIEGVFGPGTPGWLPYTMISPNLVTAVLVSEDGHFFSHDGFDVEAMEKSIRENLSQGRFVRGASTISMQLAKNLYLSREKTLARKLKEALLTQLLEQELSKHELIELYLNVIEYAPGVYGAAAAARHYFGTTADALSLGQAFYMASVLPNPKRQHFAKDGHVGGRWAEYLRSLMRVARRIGRITDAELQRGLAEQVQYQVSGSTYGFGALDGEAGAEDSTSGSGGDELPAGAGPVDWADEALRDRRSGQGRRIERPVRSGAKSREEAAVRRGRAE